MLVGKYFECILRLFKIFIKLKLFFSENVCAGCYHMTVEKERNTHVELMIFCIFVFASVFV